MKSEGGSEGGGRIKREIEPDGKKMMYAFTMNVQHVPYRC